MTRRPGRKAPAPAAPAPPSPAPSPEEARTLATIRTAGGILGRASIRPDGAPTAWAGGFIADGPAGDAVLADALRHLVDRATLAEAEAALADRAARDAARAANIAKGRKGHPEKRNRAAYAAAALILRDDPRIGPDRLLAALQADRRLRHVPGRSALADWLAEQKRRARGA